MAGKMKCCGYRLRDLIARQKRFMLRAVGIYKKAGGQRKSDKKMDEKQRNIGKLFQS